MRSVIGVIGVLSVLVLSLSADASAETIHGRWKLIAAEDLRADGSVARHPWGPRPVGVIVVEGGFCYLQIMSGDVPSFPPAADRSVAEQMQATLLSSYIAYTGPCVVDDVKGSVTLKVTAAWRPDYVGTEQVRYFRFDNGRLLFGPAANTIAFGGERLTRRLTLERAPGPNSSPGGSTSGQSNAHFQAQVQEAERAFAQTMADRDHAAFTRWIAEDAVFLAEDRVLRGRDAIAAGWKPFFQGPAAPFAWQPARVEVLSSGLLAISTGPVRDPQGKQIGTFTSTWRREADGRWRVILDSGCRCPGADR
jgi:uncharacterized protein (TIGR02246 family)